MSNDKRCDRCGKFYTFNSLYGESDVVRIALLNGYGHNKENYDLCQRCRDKLMKWLEGNKKYGVTFVVHTVSDYDLSHAHENILTSLSGIPGVLICHIALIFLVLKSSSDAEIQKHVLVGCDRIIMCPTVLVVWSFFANQQRSVTGNV